MAGEKSGYNADLTVGGYTGANLTDVSVDINGTVVDVSVLADEWRRNVADTFGWTVTGNKNVVTEDFLTLLTSNLRTSVVVKVTDPLASVIFSGVGFIASAGFNYPMGAAANETITVTGQGEPSNP